MKYVVSTAGDGPAQAIMLATEDQAELDAWEEIEKERPHKVLEAKDLDDLAKVAGHPIIDFDSLVHDPDGVMSVVEESPAPVVAESEVVQEPLPPVAEVPASEEPEKSDDSNEQE